MEAPVPASALIHSATLVSAGVFLTLRFKLALLSHDLLLTALTLAACLSVVLGSLGAITYYDLKKILAYSTISNCGMMIIFALYTQTNTCFLFFALHGIFKAYAFFVVGFFFKNNNHKQDYRYFGGLLGAIQPQTFLIAYIILSLGGHPLTLLYFVKHAAILAIGGLTSHYLAASVHLCLTLAASASLLYSVRIVYSLLCGTATFRPREESKYEMTYEYLLVIVLFVVYQAVLFTLVK